MTSRINVIIDELTDSKVNLGSVFFEVQLFAHQLKNAYLKDLVMKQLCNLIDLEKEVETLRNTRLTRLSIAIFKLEILQFQVTS